MEVRSAWTQHWAMRNTSFWLLSLVFGLVTLPAQPRITVTLFDIAGLQPDTVETMKKEAVRIFDSAGVTLDWLDCERMGKPMNLAECSKPSGTTRLMLQLVSGINKAKPRISGFATLQNGSGVFACLYPDRIKELARDTNWDLGDLLGHAAAHEIGHLLLRTTAHSSAGIMRAKWETEDLRRLSNHGLVFLRGQLAGVTLHGTAAVGLAADRSLQK